MSGPAASGAEGGLIVDKPSGPTSHDIVTAARRALGVKRVGHAGTLDPAATGVLVLLVGRATRLARFLAGHDKEYEAVVRFGWATDTYDAAGRPAGSKVTASPARAAVETALGAFRGTFLQRPPPVSAKKVGGQRAYALARREAPVDLAPVAVTVSAVDLIALDGDTARLRLTCTAGFYVRALAHDLGVALGIGAHLAALRRTRSGPFQVSEALSVTMLTDDVARARASMVAPAQLLPELPAVVVTPAGLRRVTHGQAVPPGEWRAVHALQQMGPVRLLDESGRLLAVADERDAALHPFVVLV